MITIPQDSAVPHARSWRIFSLVALGLILSIVPSWAGEAPLRFLANGTLIGLKLGGGEVLREGEKPSGFFALFFNGVGVKEIPFQKVTFENGHIRLIGPNGFPRLEFSVSEEGGQLTLALVRVEGMPLGKDSSVMFRAATTVPLAANSDGAGVKVESDKKGVRIFWISPIQRAEGAKTFGGVTLKKQF